MKLEILVLGGRVMVIKTKIPRKEECVRTHTAHTHIYIYIYTHLLSLIKVMLNDNYNHASLK